MVFFGYNPWSSYLLFPTFMFNNFNNFLKLIILPVLVFIVAGCQNPIFQLQKDNFEEGWIYPEVIDTSIEEIPKEEIKPITFKGKIVKSLKQPDGFIEGEYNALVNIIPDEIKIKYIKNVVNSSIFSKSDTHSELVVDNDLIYSLGSDHKLRAFKLQTGEKVWEYKILSTRDIEKIENQIGAISIAEDSIIVCLATGELIKLKINPNKNLPPKELWRYSCKHSLKTAALISEDRIVATSVSGYTLALDKKTGKFLWGHNCFSRNIVIMGGAVPLIHNGVVYVAHYSKEVYALNLYNGKLLWSSFLQQYQRDITSSDVFHVKSRPLIIKDTLLSYGFDKLVFYDVKQGLAKAVDNKSHLPWDESTKHLLYNLDIGGSQPVLHYNGRLFFVNKYSKLYCLDFNTRKIIWHKQLEYINEKTEEVTFWYGPILVQKENSKETYLALTNNTGSLVFIDANDPTKVKTILTGLLISHAPFVVDKKLLILSGDGEVIVFDKKIK